MNVSRKEQPWLVVIAGNAPQEAPKLKAGDAIDPQQAWELAQKGEHATRSLDIALVERKLKERNVWSGGEAGPRLSPEERRRIAEDYIKRQFAKEHPNMKIRGSDNGGNVPVNR